MDNHIGGDKLEASREYDMDNEKGYAASPTYLAKDGSSNTSQEDDDILQMYDEKQQKRIIHRVDLRLVSMAGVMYCVSLLDRTNLSFAAVAG